MGEDTIIVFLEDDCNRAALKFQRMSKKDQERTFWVRTVKEAIEILRDYRERLDIVYLDYDLTGEGYDNTSREDCGMEVVRWLEVQQVSDYLHVDFIIHTWNIPAGKKMVSRLTAKGYNAIQKPFGL